MPALPTQIPQVGGSPPPKLRVLPAKEGKAALPPVPNEELPNEGFGAAAPLSATVPQSPPEGGGALVARSNDSPPVGMASPAMLMRQESETTIRNALMDSTEAVKALEKQWQLDGQGLSKNWTVRFTGSPGVGAACGC